MSSLNFDHFLITMSSDYFNWECMYGVLLSAQKWSVTNRYIGCLQLYTQFFLWFLSLSLLSPIPAHIFEFIKAPANFELDTEF